MLCVRKEKCTLEIHSQTMSTEMPDGYKICTITISYISILLNENTRGRILIFEEYRRRFSTIIESFYRFIITFKERSNKKKPYSIA